LDECERGIGKRRTVIGQGYFGMRRGALGKAEKYGWVYGWYEADVIVRRR
jgi:hypothetical protein